MLRRVEIENFKSIEKLAFDVGRVNVLIGENGAGKSNVLEALAFASAAAGNKLDNEFLVSRGVRVTDARFMRAAFPDSASAEIRIALHEVGDGDGDEPIAGIEYRLVASEEGGQPGWRRVDERHEMDELHDRMDALEQRLRGLLGGIGPPLSDKEGRERPSAESRTMSPAARAARYASLTAGAAAAAESLRAHAKGSASVAAAAAAAAAFAAAAAASAASLPPPWLEHFLVYSPENGALRTFQAEGQILPLGITGAGLFSHLKYLATTPEHAGRVVEIADRLAVLDWFERLEIPKDLAPGERAIAIRDRYLARGAVFDQRSANEGFLFLLFYYTLFISPHTPRMFAIDNVDASLNPKLCSALVKDLVGLAKTHHKQVLLTTHNPAVLDGLDLHDDDQRLLVVDRGGSGYTRVRRVGPPTPIDGQPAMKLSEAFMRGYIGGLPKSF